MFGINDINVNVKAIDNLSPLKRVYDQARSYAAEKQLNEQRAGINAMLNKGTTAPLREFISTISKSGLSSPNRFKVIVTTPKLLYSRYAQDVSLLCESVSTPPSVLHTAARITYGPPIELPIARVHSDLSMTFIMDNDYKPKILFDQWIDSILDYNQLNNSYRPSYDVGFFSEYSSQIEIMQLVPIGDEQVVYMIRFNGAYPYQIQMNEFNHMSQNIFHRLNVSFKYEFIDAYKVTVTSDELTKSTGSLAGKSTNLKTYGEGLKGIYESVKSESFNELTNKVKVIAKDSYDNVLSYFN